MKYNKKLLMKILCILNHTSIHLTQIMNRLISEAEASNKTERTNIKLIIIMASPWCKRKTTNLKITWMVSFLMPA